jgi:glycosyltransferase involved in cell wall biosynthesis
MRIAFITFEYPPLMIGGAGIYAMNIANRLAKLGNLVTVFTPRIDNLDEEESITSNLKVKRIRTNERLPFRALQFWLLLPGEIRKAENENEFDVIHINGISYWFLKRQLSKAPHILTVHHLVVDSIRVNNLNLIERILDISGENSIFSALIEDRCVKSADKIIAVSEFTKARIVQIYRVRASDIEVIHNGVDLNAPIYNKADLEKIKRRLNLDERPIILFVGRIDDPRKGLPSLLKAFEKVLDKINAILLVVGKGEQSGARKLSGSLGISENVFFVGFVNEEDLKNYYALCDIFVSSSRLEGFGLTILEAMVAGKPVVATNVGAIPELVKNGENGILVGIDDIDSLSNAIYFLLKNEMLAEDIGERNKKCVKDIFNWEMAAKKVEQLYIELIQRSRP